MTDWLPGYTKRTHPVRNLAYYPAYDTAPSGLVPWTLDAHPVLVIHSTEGTETCPGYKGGANNPHVTIDPWRGNRWQHLPLNVAGRATATGFADVRKHGVDVEIVGYCDFKTATANRQASYLLDNLTGTQMQWLADRLAEVSAAVGIAVSTSVTFKAYNSGIVPSSYGTNNGVRLSRSAFVKASGWVGHQHVPGDVHGDPGNLDVKRLVALAGGKKATTTTTTKKATTTTTTRKATTTTRKATTTTTTKKVTTTKRVTYPIPTRALLPGDVGEDVKWVQDGLRRRYSYGSKLVVDGQYGNATATAVRKFQTATGLDPDGHTGPLTRAMMKKEWKA